MQFSPQPTPTPPPLPLKKFRIPKGSQFEINYEENHVACIHFKIKLDDFHEISVNLTLVS